MFDRGAAEARYVMVEMDPMGDRTARSSFPNSERRATAKIRSFFTGTSSKRKSTQQRKWTPPALHPATLTLAILIPLGLILTLYFLLKRSQRDQGIIFAPEINALPFSRTFMYQYFPTMVALVFSILWAWIDLETKRLEPFFRLSTEEGALGKDSLLLAYPFGFVPLVPIRALRKRHWAVFWASLALVLVTWGLVPTQAGIFSTKRISRTFPTSLDVSTSFVPVAEQPNVLTHRFAQSTYGIVVLNESLPAYTAINYTLAPFKPSSLSEKDRADQQAEQWTAPTTLYSLDLHCELATFDHKVGRHTNSKGCSFSEAPSGNDTIHADPESILSTVKGFSALHAPYWNSGESLFYLSSQCPRELNHTFFAAFTQNKEKASDPPQNVTAIFCELAYYMQEVNATIDSSTMHPAQVFPRGPKREIDATIFNTTWMEQQLSYGYNAVDLRGDALPDALIPNYIEKLVEMNLSWTGSQQPILGLAMVAGQRSQLEDYLDWNVLATSYAKAYQLLFARAMVDVLQSQEFEGSGKVMGERVVDSEAVIIEPIFTSIVQAFLGVVAVLAMVLLYLNVTRETALYTDPGTVASIMGLVANNKMLLADFEGLDCCTNEEIQEVVADKRFKLVEDNQQISIIELVPSTGNTNSSTISSLLKKHSNSLKSINRPVRPVEFSSWLSTLFLGLFLGLAIALGVLFARSTSNGIALPSQNSFVQNLLENYIPTAIATLIEPVWVLINRLLCLLQPIEELQGCNAKAKESIDISYGSLPPQLVIWKALRARHFVLVAVCTMALLANLLAIAFAGLFHHQTIEIRMPTTFQPPFELKFTSINGSIGPLASSSFGPSTGSGAYRGGNGRAQFLTLESYYTKSTPLLAWTDKSYFYLPFIGPPSIDDGDEHQYEAETTVFGAELDCKAFEPGLDYSVDLYPPPTESNSHIGSIFNNTLSDGSNTHSTCISNYQVQVSPGPRIGPAFEYGCQRGPVALELVLSVDPANSNASQAEKGLCWSSLYLGWVRNPEGSCGASEALNATVRNSFFVQCRPKLVRGRATVLVDSNGRLLKKAENIAMEHDYDSVKAIENFENDPINLISQSNRYIFMSSTAFWHNDSYASDFMNHFIQLESNSRRLLDPTSSPPTLEDVQGPLSKAYAALFAAWLGANKEHLLVARTSANQGPLEGWKIEKEERLFLSAPLFAIAEAILCTYALVACLVYVRRPGKYLARLPTSVASVIALFAGSTAVQGMRDVSRLEKKARGAYLEQLDYRYGYGSYVGRDGRVHIGIEKTPFVRAWKSVSSQKEAKAGRKAAV